MTAASTTSARVNTTTTNSSNERAPIGVLLANLGTPRSPATADVRRYLREFLSDPKVVRAPRWVWFCVLNGIILPFRASRSAKLYRSIWMEQGSPLLVHSRTIACELAGALGENYRVALGMRYGEPSLRQALESLQSQGVQRIVLMPLFPQQSDTTTGTLEERLCRLLAQPELAALRLRSISAWPDQPQYIRALAESIRATPGFAQAEHFVLSYHGLPQSYVRRGDPYLDHCNRTTRALVAELGWSESQYTQTFQSRFGPQRWLEPSTEDTICTLAKRHRRVLVATPGFPADCLETLEEIAVGLRERFHEEGGEELFVTPCLNGSAGLAAALGQLVREQKW
jgi:ferrochelatase